jgi:hypothetical protein
LNLAERSYKNKERGVHAFFLVFLPHFECSHVVLLWLSKERPVCCCKLIQYGTSIKVFFLKKKKRKGGKSIKTPTLHLCF